MNKLHTNQSGFTLIETILVLVIVVAIAGVGLFVWHSKQVADKTLAPTHSTNPTFKNNAKGKSAETGTNAAKPSTPASTPTSYFAITQWHIRAPYSGSLTLEYQQNSSNPDEMMVSSAQLNAGGPSTCTTADGGAGYIGRYAPTDEVAPGETAQQYVNQNFAAANSQPPAYAKIGNYYYIYSDASNDCSDTALQTQTTDAFDKVVDSLTAY